MATSSRTSNARTRKTAQAEAAQAIMGEDFVHLPTLPSVARVTCAVIAGVLSYGATVYYASHAVNAITLATAVLAGPGLITFLVSMIGYAIAIAAALGIGYRVAKWVIGIETGDFTRARDTARAMYEQQSDAARERARSILARFRKAEPDATGSASA